MATPGTFSSSGISSPGILRSTIKVSLGSGESSGSSTMAWRMLSPALLRITAVLDRMPMPVAFVGVISTTPKFRCLAISFRLWPAGRICSNIMQSSGLLWMLLRVSLTVRRSTFAARATRIGGISILLT